MLLCQFLTSYSYRTCEYISLNAHYTRFKFTCKRAVAYIFLTELYCKVKNNNNNLSKKHQHNVFFMFYFCSLNIILVADDTFLLSNCKVQNGGGELLWQTLFQENLNNLWFMSLSHIQPTVYLHLFPLGRNSSDIAQSICAVIKMEMHPLTV